MAINPTSYLRNVGKSMGYIAVEALGNNAPVLRDLFAENKDTVQSLYQEIKDFAASPIEKIKSNEKIMSYSNDLKYGFKNLMDDIKTGNLYNIERQNEAMMGAFGLDDFNMDDFDFDADLNDLNSDIKGAFDDSTDKEVAAMDDIGSRISSSVSMATAKSAEFIVQSNLENTRALMSQNSHIFKVMSTGFTGINKTLGDIAQLAQPLTSHMQNSAVFFTQSTKNQEKMIELLEQISENTKRPEAKKKNGRETFGIDAFLGGGYAFNLSSMGSMMKKNAKEAFENSTLGMLAGFSDMFGEGTSILKIIGSNPIGFAMPFLIDAMMTKKLKKSMESLSNTMASFNIKLIRDLNNLTKSSNPILSFIGQLFNFEDLNAKKRDTGEYEKGAISFDGVTKHAIVRVIPEYLGMILNALGGPQTRYDYKAGKFVTKADIRRERKKEFNREVENIGFEARMETYEMGVDEVSAARIRKSIDKYVSNALREGNYIDPRQKYTDADLKKFGISQEQMKDIQSLIKYYERTGQYGAIEQLNMSIREARNARASRVMEDPYLSNEDYMLDNGFNMMKNAVGYTGSYRRESRTSGSSRSSSGSGNSEPPGRREEITSDDLSMDFISNELQKKGYEKGTKIYQKFLDRYKSAKTPQDKERIAHDLNNLKEKNSSNTKKKGFLDRFFNAQDNDEDLTGVRKLISGPMNFLADQLDKASKTMYEIMYGKEMDENAREKKFDTHSIIGNMFNHMNDLFTTFKDHIKNDIIEPVKGFFEERGGLLNILANAFGIDDPEGIRGYFKNKIKEIGKNVSANFGSAGKWLWNNSPVGAKLEQIKQHRRDVANAAHYQEIEDLYSGEARNETFIIDPYDMEGEGSKLRRRGRGSGLRRYRGGASAEQTINNAKQKMSDFFDPNSNGFGYQVGKEVHSGLKTFFEHIMPDKSKADEEFDKIHGVIKESVKQIGLDPSGAITGGLIGGGVSLLTGGMVSPILAASIGAAAGLTIKSKAVQDMLFGKEVEVLDEEGNVVGKQRDYSGLFSKEISDFLTKQVPTMAAWGATGGIMAMLPGVPGGPVAGLILGSALGFASKNEKVQEFLWGNDKENGLLGSKEDREKKAEWIKHMLPKAAAGAIIGAAAGPFGFMGNIFAGAALGFASETETFKSILFGKVTGKDENGNDIREGGITAWIKKDIISPVASAIKPIAVEIKNKGTDIIRWTIRSIANVFGKTIGSPMFKVLYEKLLKPIGGMVPGFAKGIGAIISTPFRAVGALGRGLRKKQIRTGRANDMTAAARLQYRNENFLGTDEFTDFDTTLSNMEDSDISNTVAELQAARKSKNQMQIDAAINKFQTQFGLQNVNLNNKNIDKYLDTVKAEMKNRKNGGATNLDPEKVRNQLIDSHASKIETMVGAIANKILRRKVFDVELPGGQQDITETAATEEGEENAPNSVTPTRRSFKTTVKSIFNPFTGMDMGSVTEALQYYEDKLAGNSLGRYGSVQNRLNLNKMVQKVEVNGEFRDDIVNVTDKNGYTVTVQKVNGSWMPYKIGQQLKESLSQTRIGKGIVTAGKVIGGVAKAVWRAITQNPFFGIDDEVANNVASYYLRFKGYANPPLSRKEHNYLFKHAKIMEVQYPGENVLQVTDDDGKAVMVRFDEKSGKWKSLDPIWRAQFIAKQAGRKIVGGVKAVARKVQGIVLGAVDAIRHINPFCDFDSDEVGPIVDSLNDMEEGGSDSTGKIQKVPGLNHYYTVTSSNGATTTVTPKFGKWVYVSPKELRAARARRLTAGIGGMVKNLATKAINSFNKNKTSESAEGGSSRLLRGLIGAGSTFSLFGAIKTKLAKDGQEVIDMADKESRGTIKLRDKFFDEFHSIAEYVKKIFHVIPDEDQREEEEEKKKGLFDSLLNGEGGLLGGIASLFGQTKLGRFASGFMSKLPSLPTIIAGAAGVGLGALGLKFVTDSVKGKWDDVAHKLGWGSLKAKTTDENWDETSGAKVTEGTGVNEAGQVEAVAYDKDGNVIMDENGNILSTKGNILTNFKANTGTSFGQKVIGNTARGLITGTSVASASAKAIGWGLNKMTNGAAGRLAGKTIGRVAGNAGSKIATTIGKSVASSGGLTATFNRLSSKAASHGIKTSVKGLETAAANVLEREAGTVIADQLMDPKNGQIFKVFNALKKLPVLKGFASTLDDMAAGLSETLAKKMAGKSAEEIGKAVLGVAAFAAKVLLIAWDFEEGYNHAQRTLGIKEPTTGQKILSGIIRAVKNLIPIVGSLIPDKLLVDLFVKYIAPALGMDVNEFMKQREDFEAEATAAGMSVEDYVQSVGQQEGWGEKTWGEGIVSGVKTLGVNIKSGFKKAGSTIANAATSVKEAATPIFNTAKSSLGSLFNSSKDIYTFLLKGDLKGLFEYAPMAQVDEDNPLAKILDTSIFINKISAFPLTAVSWVAHKIGDFIGKVAEGAKNVFLTANDSADQLTSYVKEGDVSGLIGAEYQEDTENPLNGFGKVMFGISKISDFIPTCVSWLGHKAFDTIKDGIDAVKFDIKFMTDNIYNIKEQSDFTEGDEGVLSKIKNIWGTKNTYSSPLKGLFNIIETISKVVYTIVGAVSLIAEPVAKFVNKVKEKAQAVAEGVGNKVSEIKEGASEWWSNTKETVANTKIGQAWNTLRHGKQSGSGSFVSQLDPRVAGRRFGSSTIGANGCAPSVASMITGMDLGTTASMAANGGYTNNYGTSADYFSNVFAANGIPAEYVYTGAGSAQDYLASRIASGSPTVLLGQDRYNTSKAYSPFGPGNHYVLATGMTRDGGVVVQDPESSRPNMVYDRSILNSVKLGIPTGGRSRLRRLRGGAAMTNVSADAGSGKSSKVVGTGNATDNQKQVWTFLKKKGLSDAGAAGLMGCWEAESGNRPDRIEGDYMKSFPGFNTVASSSEALDNYTVNTLFPAYKKIKINQSAYKASDGHYYPGFGLAQWTGGRGLELLNFCKQRGWDWKTLKAQLEFAWSELSGKYSGVLAELKKDGDVAAMCKIAYNKYEGCKREDWLKIRQQHAATIYSALTGRTYSMPTNAGSATSFAYGTSSISTGETAAMNATNGDNSSGGIGGALTTFGSLFGQLVSSAFGKLGQLFGLSSSSEEGTSTGGDISDTGYSGSYESSETSNEVLQGLPFNESSKRGKMQKALVEKMASVVGKLKYSQDGPRDPDKGSADCSSTVNWAYKKILGETIGNNTLEMFNNSSNMSAVDRATGVSQSGYNNKTSGPNLNNLQPGDIMLFSRNGDYAKGRPYQVGHVSMYMGDGKALSHGSGMGPKVVNIAGDPTYLVAKRYSPFVNGEYDEISSARQNEYAQASTNGAYVGTGSGLRGYNIAQDAYNTINRKHRASRSVFGAGSKIVNMSSYTDTRKAKYVAELTRSLRGGASDTNNEVLIALIKAVISLLANVSSNSDKINAAMETLQSILKSQSVGESSENGDKNLNQARNALGIADTDETLNELQQLLGKLASGS